jgi:hypothetical protein
MKDRNSRLIVLQITMTIRPPTTPFGTGTKHDYSSIVIIFIIISSPPIIIVNCRNQSKFTLSIVNLSFNDFVRRHTRKATL